jgi:hypothetical protein
MRLINVVSTAGDSSKKYTATFCECKGATKCLPKDRKKISFGSKNSNTYSDGSVDEKTRDNYIKRHKVNENWNSINAGSLSRYILWSKKTLAGGIAEFRKRFNC